ncbi:MAG: hypothetical protein ACXITV_11220 [Luteibaculaceae bacterium]
MVFKLRNRFKIQSPFSAQEIHERVKEHIVSQKLLFLQYKKITENHRALCFGKQYRNLFTPQVDLVLEPKEKETEIRCLIGPEPTIWTFFAFIYGMLAVILLFSAMHWSAYYSMGKSANSYLISLLSGILIVATYLVVLYTKSKQQRQMDFLKKVVEDSLSMHQKVNSTQQLG